jgi:hypothetical protein
VGPCDGRGRWHGGGPARGGARARGPDGAVGRIGEDRAAAGSGQRAASGVGRWVWRATGEADPRLLADRVRVERWYDTEDAKNLLPGHEGRLGGSPAPPPPRSPGRGFFWAGAEPGPGRSRGGASRIPPRLRHGGAVRRPVPLVKPEARGRVPGPPIKSGCSRSSMMRAAGTLHG